MQKYNIGTVDEVFITIDKKAEIEDSLTMIKELEYSLNALDREIERAMYDRKIFKRMIKIWKSLMS
jgi:hypothetical protein